MQVSAAITILTPSPRARRFEISASSSARYNGSGKGRELRSERLKTETLGKSVRWNVPRGRLEDVRDDLADLLRRHRAA
jgi:hypothetical protein